MPETARILMDGRYTVIGPRFTAMLRVDAGRVMPEGSAPILHRLWRMDAQAFWYHARNRGWRVEARHA